MLRIRLQRVGRKKQATYRFVVSERARDTQGRALEIVGSYNPTQHPKIIDLKKDRMEHWISMGAQPSETVHNILVTEGVIKGDKQRSVSITKKRQTKIDKRNSEKIAAKAAKEEAIKAEAEAKKVAEAEAKEAEKAAKAEAEAQAKAELEAPKAEEVAVATAEVSEETKTEEVAEKVEETPTE